MEDENGDRLIYLAGGPAGRGGARHGARAAARASPPLQLHLRVPGPHHPGRGARRPDGGRGDGPVLGPEPRLLPDPALHAAVDRGQARRDRLRRADGLRPQRGRARLAAGASGWPRCGRAERSSGARNSGLERARRTGSPSDLGLKRVLDAARGVLPARRGRRSGRRGGNLLAATRAGSRPCRCPHRSPAAGRCCLGAPRGVARPGRASRFPSRGRGSPSSPRDRQVGWLDVWGDGQARERAGATDPRRRGAAAGGDPRPGRARRPGHGLAAVTGGSFPKRGPGSSLTSDTRG